MIPQLPFRQRPALLSFGHLAMQVQLPGIGALLRFWKASGTDTAMRFYAARVPEHMLSHTLVKFPVSGCPVHSSTWLLWNVSQTEHLDTPMAAKTFRWTLE